MPTDDTVGPGNPGNPDIGYRSGTLYAKLEHYGFLGHAYKIPVEELYAAVKKGYDDAADTKDEKPMTHSAYSSKLPEGHRQLMHSRRLPLN